MKALVGFLVGLILGFIAGVIIFRVVAGPADGWSDLTSVAGSLFTFTPVGALTGLAFALRKRPWPWVRMAVAGLFIGAIPVVFIRDSAITAWGLGAYGLLLGAAIAWWVDRLQADRPTFG
jgi:hypothetical protein